MKRIAMMAACLLMLGMGCGGDDGGGASNSGGTGGAGGAGGASGAAGSGGDGGTSGGTGGTGGAGGAGGTGGTGGTPAPEPVVCGDVTCDVPMSRSIRACCVAGTDECGQELVGGFGADCSVPAVSHPDCEDGMLTGFGGGGMTIPSCCTPEGACGLAAPLLGFDCTSNEEIIEMTTPDADAGVSDAGARPNRPMLVPPTPATCTP